MNNTIHLGFYSDVAKFVFTSFIDHIRTYSGPLRRFGNKFSVIVNPDGEVVLTDGEGGYGWSSVFERNKNNTPKVKSYIANHIKRMTIEECGTDGAWRRDNVDRTVDRLSYTKLMDVNAKKMNIDYGEINFSERLYVPNVAEIYCIYDILMGRKNIEHKYGKELMTKIAGEKRDPIATEMEVARRQEIASLRNDYNAKIEELKQAMFKKISDFRTKCENECNELKKIEKAKFEEKLAELENFKIPAI